MKRKDGEKKDRTMPRSTKPLTNKERTCRECGRSFKLAQDQDERWTLWCTECRRHLTFVETMTRYMTDDQDRHSTMRMFKRNPHRKTSVTW